MKKLYTLLAAATFATSAFAAAPHANPAEAVGTLIDSHQLTRIEASALQAHYATTATSNYRKAAPIAPETGWKTLGEGSYRAGLLITYLRPTGAQAGDEWSVTVEENTTGGEHWYRFAPYATGPFPPAMENTPDPTYMYINATDPEKVYSLDFTAYGLPVGQFCPESPAILDFFKSIGGTEAELAKDALYGYMEDGAIYFPSRSHLIYIPKEITEQEADAWYYANLDGDLGLALPGSKFVSYWKTVGTAEFTDGVMGAMFKGEAIKGTYTLQQHVEQPSVYQIVSPWAQLNASGNFIFNVMYPECVQVPFQPTGVMETQEGATWIVGLTSNVPDGTTLEDVLNNPELQPYIMTMKDDVVTIPENAIGFNWPDGSNPDRIYTANKPIASSIVMKFDTNSIEDVSVSDENAPVEYFNLQGVRVANPENGLFIRRQGNKTTKVFVK